MVLKKVVKFCGGLVLVGILVPSTILAVTGTVTGNNVRIRKEADSKSIEISVATKDEKVEVIGEKGNWYNVKFENVTGYISKEYVNTNYKSSNSVDKPANTNNSSNINNTVSNDNTNTSNSNNVNNTVSNDNTNTSNSNNVNNTVSNDNTNTSNSSNINNTVSNDNTNTSNSNNVNNTVSNTISSDNESLATDNNVTQENTSSSLENSNEENTSSDSIDTVSSVVSKKYEKNQTIKLKQDVSLRYLPNFTSRVYGTAQKDSTYTVQASLNNWVKISNENNSGWILKINIDDENSENESINNSQENKSPNENVSNNTASQGENISKGKVNVPSAVIRKAPNGEKIDSLAQGTEVTILSEENDWYKIKTKDYESCYIAKRLITKK